MRYIIAEIEDEEERFVHDVYTANCLQIAVNNIANTLGGSVVKNSYYDIITKKTVKETRTAEEIYQHIKSKLESGK